MRPLVIAIVALIVGGTTPGAVGVCPTLFRTTGALEVIETSGDVDLDRRAFEAVKTWRFKPATGPDGAPVEHGAR